MSKRIDLKRQKKKESLHKRSARYIRQHRIALAVITALFLITTTFVIYALDQAKVCLQIYSTPLQEARVIVNGVGKTYALNVKTPPPGDWFRRGTFWVPDNGIRLCADFDLDDTPGVWHTADSTDYHEVLHWNSSTGLKIVDPTGRTVFESKASVGETVRTFPQGHEDWTVIVASGKYPYTRLAWR